MVLENALFQRVGATHDEALSSKVLKELSFGG